MVSSMGCASCKCSLLPGKVKYWKWVFKLPFLRSVEGFVLFNWIILNPQVLAKESWYLRALLKHEAKHLEQIKSMGRLGYFKFLLKYLFRKGRLALEVEAFKEELKWWPDTLESLLVLSHRLVNNYNLGITFEEAKTVLSNNGKS